MKRIHIILLLSSLLIFWNSLGVAATTVSFREKAAVNSSKICLADIADITPASGTQALGQIDIAPAPQLGQIKTLEIAPVLTSLQQNPLVRDVIWQGSAQVLVLRQTTRIEKDQLIEIVENFIDQNRDSMPEGELRFTPLRAPKEVLLPRGEVSWRVKPSRPEIVNSSSFSIYFQVDEKPVKNCTVRGKLEILHPVAVALENIKRGQPITEGSIGFIQKDVTQLRHPIFSAHEVIGMLAKRTLKKGRAINYEHITFPPVIAEGELVKIFATKGNLKITTNGIAKSSGLTGEIIRVRNITSNKLIYARVDAPGIVSVEF